MLVKYLANALAPHLDMFTYYPFYGLILAIPSAITNSAVTEVTTSIETSIATVQNYDATGNTITISTDSDLASSRDIIIAGILQSGGVSYKILQVNSSLSPLTIVIANPDLTVPRPKVGSKCTLSILKPSVVIAKTDKKAKSWRWFVGGEMVQGRKSFSVVGQTSDAELLVAKLADGTAPTTGPFAYHPTDSTDPITKCMVVITSTDTKAESAYSISLSVSAVYNSQPMPPALKIATPVLPENPPCELVEPADWYGRSFYTLEWLAEANMLYQVYRAMDASIYDLDREKMKATWDPSTRRIKRRQITDENLPQRMRIHPQKDLILQAIQQDFTNLDEKLELWRAGSISLNELNMIYKNLRNDTHEVLANLPGTEAAYTLITT